MPGLFRCPCGHCGRAFHSRDALLRHLGRLPDSDGHGLHSAKARRVATLAGRETIHPLGCLQCNKKFAEEGAFAFHLAEAHPQIARERAVAVEGSRHELETALGPLEEIESRQGLESEVDRRLLKQGQRLLGGRFNRRSGEALMRRIRARGF